MTPAGSDSTVAFRSARRAALAAAVALAAVGVPAAAHEIPCNHFHEPSNRDKLISCTNDGAACEQDGNGGTCKEITDNYSSICTCQVAQPDGSCSSSGLQYFDSQGAGVPSPNASIIYLAQGDPSNWVNIFFGSEPGIHFEAETTFLGGTFTVVFPPFAEGETEVIATLDDVSLSFAPVGSSGTNFLELEDGFPQLVLYNDATGRISPLDPGGVRLHLDNNYWTNQAITVFFEARLLADGAFELFFQHQLNAVLFADNLESGQTSLWSETAP